ncbi:TPA: LamG-like jellyroll fold domain-containing protein [Escherichia coli]
MAIRPKLNRVWTSNNSVARRDPGDEKYLKGWVAEIPTYQVLNYLQYKIDTTMLAQAERGIFEWGNDVSYGVGSLAWDETNKTIYVCTVASPNKTLRPSANSAQWSPSSIQVSRANYDSIVAAINAHIADVTTNPHKVTAAQIGAYNKSELDSIVANYRAMVQAHVTDYNNPHQLTATQVGAVPVTGGAYTGEVTFTTVYLNDSKTTQIVNDGGLYLRNGSYYLGVNGTTGNPEAGTAASKSRIVTELNFPDVKAAQEPGYAAPQPTVSIPLVRSLNMVLGVGTVISDTEPTYDDSQGGVFSMSGETGFSMSGSYSFGTGALSICFDYNCAQVPGDTGLVCNIGFNGFRVIVRRNGNVLGFATISSGNVQVANTGMIPSNLSGQFVRIALTYDGTTCTIYINGVAVSSGVLSSPQIGANTVLLQTHTGPNRVSIRNLRLWKGSSLTAKQVSTL